MPDSVSNNGYSYQRSLDGFHIRIGRHYRSIIDVPAHEIESTVFQAIEGHKRQINSCSERVKKNALEASISLISISGLPLICVKHFKNRGSLYSIKGLFRPTHGTRAIQNGSRLFGAGFTTAVPIALVQRSKWGCVLEEWLVMAAIKDSLELDRYLVGRIRSKWPDDEKHLFIKFFANFLGTIHEFGAFHADLKTCNIIVTNPSSGVMSISPEINDFNPVSFSLIDYDDVRYFSSGVNMEKRAKNLAQLFLSTPSDINLADRSEFFRIYLDVCAKNENYGAKLLKAAKKRIEGKTLLYVGPDGDITEDWPQQGLEECCYHWLGKS